jgi:hypothetical protein
MRVAFFALFTTAILPGCGSGTQGCTVDVIAAADVAGLNVTDCGDFTSGSAAYTDAAMATAQSCVLGAVNGGSAFRLSYDATDSNGKTTGLRAAFTGAVIPTGLSLRSYAGSGSGISELVSGRSCTTVTATTSCTPRVGVPCLTCGGDDPDTLVCRG